MVFRRITVGYVVFLTGCMKPVETAPLASSAVENSWRFELQLEVETQWLKGGEGEELPAGAPVDSTLGEEGLLDGGLPEDLSAGLADFQVSWAGQVTEGPYRINRDGTESWRLRFEQVRDEQGQTQALEGRAMETRRFPGGALLSLAQTEWVSSVESMGDGLDAMVALLYLLPPERKKDRLLFTDFAWPYRLDAGRRSQHTVPLSWKEDGEFLRFEGPLSGRIQDRDWNLRSVSNGLLSGTLKLSDTGEVDETRFNLERSIRYSSGTGDWTLVQKQRLSGVLAAGESRVVEPWPRVFYLEEKDILGPISDAASDWEACAPEPDWSAALDFEVGTDGKVKDVQESALVGCADVLRALVFPVHHLPGLRVQTQLVLRSGVLQPYPRVRFPENPKPPLHFLIAPGENRQRVVEFLKTRL